MLAAPLNYRAVMAPELVLQLALESLAPAAPVQPAPMIPSFGATLLTPDGACGMDRPSSACASLSDAPQIDTATDVNAWDACSLYVKDLARDTTELSLYQWFAPFGALTSCKVYTDPATGRCKGVAFVNFSSRAHALQAQAALHGMRVQRGHKLHIAVQAPRAVRRAVQALGAIPNRPL